MRSMRAAYGLSATAAVAVMALAASATAHSGGHHGDLSGHLSGNGAWGELELVSKLRLTDETEQVTDVAVDPNGEYAVVDARDRECSTRCGRSGSAVQQGRALSNVGWRL